MPATFKSFHVSVSEIRVGEAIWKYYVKALHNQNLFQKVLLYLSTYGTDWWRRKLWKKPKPDLYF